MIGGVKMIKRMPTHCGDDTCSSCVVAGDFIFLAHHAGGHESNDIVYQMEASFNSLGVTLETVGATFDDIVQINLYLKNIEDFKLARDVFYKYFKNGFPARMSTTTDFVSPTCLCMLDAVAYKVCANSEK
jgi:2-iminobutanoate/2-iminopropanoate deaminase